MVCHSWREFMMKNMHGDYVISGVTDTMSLKLDPL